jgi:hypothetical protein
MLNHGSISTYSDLRMLASQMCEWISASIHGSEQNSGHDGCPVCTRNRRLTFNSGSPSLPFP